MIYYLKAVAFGLLSIFTTLVLMVLMPILILIGRPEQWVDDCRKAYQLCADLVNFPITII